jgi:hypothetical protein
VRLLAINQTMTMTSKNRKSAALFDGLLAVCKRIVASDGSVPAVSMRETSYVLNGHTYTLQTTKGEFSFWFGANGPRLFFIAYVAGLDAEKAKADFAFCFGGAAKVGWQMNYEPIDAGVSIWATCMTDEGRALVQAKENCTVGLSGEQMYELTDYGTFWVTDIAMMVQSWVRTSERCGISCHDMEPAPL